MTCSRWCLSSRESGKKMSEPREGSTGQRCIAPERCWHISIPRAQPGCLEEAVQAPSSFQLPAGPNSEGALLNPFPATLQLPLRDQRTARRWF